MIAIDRFCPTFILLGQMKFSKTGKDMTGKVVL
jgi:hypothetical protein